NSRSPEALISHDSAPMQSTSEAAQFLIIQAVSRKCPIGHALDISFENWTSSLRIYNGCRFSRSAASAGTPIWTFTKCLTSTVPRLSHETLHFLRQFTGGRP